MLLLILMICLLVSVICFCLFRLNSVCEPQMDRLHRSEIQTIIKDHYSYLSFNVSCYKRHVKVSEFTFQMFQWYFILTETKSCTVHHVSENMSCPAALMYLIFTAACNKHDKNSRIASFLLLDNHNSFSHYFRVLSILPKKPPILCNKTELALQKMERDPIT